MSWVDRLVSALFRLSGKTRLYSDGLGDQKFLASLPTRIRALQRYKGRVTIQWGDESMVSGVRVRTGEFLSPAASFLPRESQKASVQWILPAEAGPETPIALHFAATGDEAFTVRRIALAAPLARKYGVASLLLENPYYGNRRPAGQQGYSVRTLSDQFKMNLATLVEGLALIDFLQYNGAGRIGVTGVSMGGSMAASVGALARRPVAIAACLAPFGPRPVFLEGALTHAVDWSALARSHGAGDVRAYVGRLMDLSDLRKFPAPRDASSAILVAGRSDYYVPAYSAQALHAAWPGSELRWLNAGHVGSALLYAEEFRRAVHDSLARLPTTRTTKRRSPRT
jgi:dienelactone hydrolase